MKKKYNKNLSSSKSLRSKKSSSKKLRSKINRLKKVNSKNLRSKNLRLEKLVSNPISRITILKRTAGHTPFTISSIFKSVNLPSHFTDLTELL